IDTGSYSKVAEKLDLTQPAVSMQIKFLEERFDTDLIIKENGKIKLTPAGKVVYSEAKKIINSWEKITYRVEESKNKSFQKIEIGSSTIPSEYLLPDILAKLDSENIDMKSSIKVGDSEEMIELLEKDKVDIIIVGYKPENSKYEVKEIAKDELKLIVPKNHKFSRKNEISIEELKNEKMLIREVGSGTRKAMLEGLKENGININELNIKCEMGSTEAIIAGVQSGLGISFVSKLASSKAHNCSRVQEVDVKGMNFSRKFYLAFNKNRKDENIIKKFIEIFNI
ncbi:MAG TPA: selenium metabolism-associated LysR family transcriptional regulator, partial [Halanaerobiales bacterium]|nr:selenium metabolism-associated LysR family transcriptional regulator [Halanaerobiales bacterium]